MPDNIAKDDSDSSGDGVLQAAISCVRCHFESGLKPFVCDFSQLTNHRVDLLSHDPKLIRLTAEFYDQQRLERQMQFDRATHDAALMRAASLASGELASALSTVYRDYAYLPVTRSQASREVGVDEARFREILLSTRDPLLLLLLTGKPILREQWENSFAEAALAATSWRNSNNDRNERHGLTNKENMQPEDKSSK